MIAGSSGSRFPRLAAILLFGVIIALFAARNLPWHLDDKDQAKQAFVSFEMVQQGEWWFQHTPTGRVATKPPLAGWISAGFYLLTGSTSWELAWRLPGFLCGVLMLAMIYQAGKDMAGAPLGGLLAAAAFGLNHFSQRLATLVRTDMMLAFFIFLAGWLVWRKMQAATSWTTRERWQIFAVILASMLTKGPIAYAFLLPGLAAFWWIARRRHLPNFAWSGWWSWFAPLLVFGIWAGLGLWLNEEFYDQVVRREFLGRFTVGEKAVHNNQPIYFYFTQLLGKFLPWSALLLVLCWRKFWRAAWINDPSRVWLACWAAGGLIFMSLVPSKRADRIYPVIPPLSLFVCAALGPIVRERPGARLALWSIVVALGVTGGAAGYEIIKGYQTDQRGLARFGTRVRAVSALDPSRLAVVNGKDEGMLLYTHKSRFTDLDDAVKGWHQGDFEWLVLSDHHLEKRTPELAPFDTLAVIPRLPQKQSGYTLLARPNKAAHPPLNDSPPFSYGP